MSLQAQPSSERIHIAFFGVRNAGKSSIVNAVTGQDLSLVSDVAGTTTDPVQKAMELLPLGPVVIIDTPGIDDVGALGEQRVERTRNVLRRAEIAVLVVSAETGLQEADRELIKLFQERKLPYLVVLNKIDLIGCNSHASQMEFDALGIASGLEGGGGRFSGSRLRENSPEETKTGSMLPAGEATENRPLSPVGQEQDRADADTPFAVLEASAVTGAGIRELKEALGRLAPKAKKQRPLVADLVDRGDFVILVTPIDASAPKGRMILPQQMMIRGLLDAGAIPVVCREFEYADTLAQLGKVPRMVITDSQVFEKIDRETPEEIPLTSFSIMMARFKGTLNGAVSGARFLKELQDGDTVLISEGCTHHRQCEDIGAVKMPNWIRNYTGKNVEFRFTSGGTFPADFSDIKMIVHCGGCMLNEKEMQSRAAEAQAAGVPMTNYGIAIAQMHGILDRSIELFD